MAKLNIWLKTSFPKLHAKLKNSMIGDLYIYMCNYKSNRYMKNRREAIQNYGYHVISKVTQYSEKRNYAIWIDGGTLLGYVREGQLLKQDYDIDFGMLALSKKKRFNLINNLAEMGFERVRCVKDSTRVYSDTFYYKGVIFDINYYFKENNYLYFFMCSSNVNRGTVIKTKRAGKSKIKYMTGHDIYKFIMSNKEFVKGEFLNGCTCIIPKNPVRRVEEMYGINWRVPIKEEYIWTRDTENEYLGFWSDVKEWGKR